MSRDAWQPWAPHRSGWSRCALIVVRRWCPRYWGCSGSGAGYLPIEQRLPTERVAFLLANAEVCALVTDAANAAVAESLLPGRVLVVDPEAEIDVDAVDHLGAPGIEPDGLAYLRYTPGAPEGAMLTHANLLNLLATTRERCRILGRRCVGRDPPARQ